MSGTLRPSAFCANFAKKEEDHEEDYQPMD